MTTLSEKIRFVLSDPRRKAELILEEAKKKESGLVVLQHDKMTGNMAFCHRHPKSKEHVVYSMLMDGKKTDAVFHRAHIEHMLGILDKEKEKKK